MSAATALGARVTELARNYAQQQEGKVRRLLAIGIPKERLCYISLADCEICHGHGSHVTSVRLPSGDYRMTLAECPRCPGLTVTR